MEIRYFKSDFPTEEERVILDDDYLWYEFPRGKVEGEVNRGNYCSMRDYIDMLTMTKAERNDLREEGCISYGFIFALVSFFDYNEKPTCEFYLDQRKDD